MIEFVRLKWAHLARANLANADLYQANLSGADLTGACKGADTEPERHLTIPPRAHGGNLDCKELGRRQHTACRYLLTARSSRSATATPHRATAQ